MHLTQGFLEIKKVWSEDVLGKIYKGANFSIAELNINDKSVENLLKYEKEKKDGSSINITATNCIKFNRNFDINDVSRLVKYLDTLKKEQFSFSLIRTLAGSKKKNDVIKKRLFSSLFTDIYHYFISLLKNQETSFNFFEFSHKDAIEYYSASKVVVIRENNVVLTYESPYGLTVKRVLEDIFNKDTDYISMKAEEIDINDEEGIKKWRGVVNRYNVVADTGGGAPNVEGKLIDFLFGEVVLDDKKYFYLDKKWFTTVDSFLRRIDEDTIKLMKRTRLDGLDFGLAWEEGVEEGKTEGEDYYLKRLQNQSYNDQYVLHKIIPNSPHPKIEICDILQFDDEVTYLCHLKPKFQGEMRTLAAQIIHATKILIDYHESGDDKIIKAYFNKVLNYSGSDEYKLKAKKNFESGSYDQFKSLFSRERKIVFVAVICNENRSIFGDLSKFDSTIAKLATSDLIKYMNTLTTNNFEFRIMQI